MASRVTRRGRTNPQTSRETQKAGDERWRETAMGTGTPACLEHAAMLAPTWQPFDVASRVIRLGARAVRDTVYLIDGMGRSADTYLFLDP